MLIKTPFEKLPVSHHFWYYGMCYVKVSVTQAWCLTKKELRRIGSIANVWDFENEVIYD